MKKKQKRGKKKKETERYNKILKIFFTIILVLVLLALTYVFYAKSQINFDYKGIDYEAEMQGDLLFYKTTTLLMTNDGSNQLFGFRLRTKPSKLEKISFEDENNFQLMKLNGYKFEGSNFECDGDGIISFVNLKRLFEKMGSNFMFDENETCDDQGRYNFFIFKPGEKTQINKIGENCYEVLVKENEQNCEILPATERMMIEIFSKFKEFQEG